LVVVVVVLVVWWCRAAGARARIGTWCGDGGWRGVTALRAWLFGLRQRERRR
jgi:hypothetical protein